MPTYTAPTATPYTSAAGPITTRTVTVKRGDGSTAGGGGSPTTIGTYLLENFSPANNGTEVRRTGTNGEDTDMAIVHKAMTASCKAQRASTSTKQPQAGDYFEEVLDGDTEIGRAHV